ncbi:transcriptional regulator [Legionella sp. km772]|uniref:helix-turn-helix transcriptional regulator n=1 Tax=Legionella sp. km772 TaxID=2498111 RepID=UPI0018F7A132|nr:PAS domain-containing protein [Legionella sp. km772]
MKKAIANYLSTAEAIQRLLHPYAEVVVHDLELDQIVAIYHPFSKRRVGDPSLFSAEEKKQFILEKCIGPYEKTNWDGKKLKSMSSIIQDENDKAVGMLCINFDISFFEQFKLAISHFLNDSNLIPQPPALFKDDWQERINQYVHSYLQEHGLTLEYLSRPEKKSLIFHLQEVGAFTGKNAAQYVAQVLKISRATVYNYLAERAED